MRTARVPFPLFALFGLTRGLAGIGIGMLLGSRLADRRRKRLGKLLLAVGATSTVPLLFGFVRAQRKRDEVGGVMDPMTGVYTPNTGTVDDAELVSPEQAETPNIRP